MTNDTIGCDRVDELIPDLMEGSLADPARSRVAAHLESCARCTALVRDLEAIRMEAGRLPALAPSRDLWDAIASRIEAPVIQLPVGVASGRRRMRWVASGVAAAGLVFVTAGVTYQLTKMSVEREVAANGRTEAVEPAAPNAMSTVPAVVVESSPAGNEQPAAPRPAAAAPRLAASPAAEPSGPVPPSAGLIIGETAYDREIRALREMLTLRESQLDPATLTVIERSLGVIDGAIAEARSALAADPGSQYLQERLARTLTRKIELLRQATLLPSST